MKFKSYFWVLCFLGLNSYSQKKIDFKKLTVDDGLSYSLVFEILRDNHGFMWFGSTDGLNKFDGHKFDVYQNIPGDSTSLADNSVWALFEDSKGNLWVGTDGGGLSLYDRQRDTFLNFKNDPDDPQSLPHNSVNVILEDSQGVLWVGTYGGGLSKLIEPGRFENFAYDETNSESISDDYIHHLFEDHLGRLWIGTRDGLNQYHRNTNSFIRYNSGESPGSINHDNVLCITEDKNGTLWLGTWGGGLNSFDPENGRFSNYQFEDSENRVAYVYCDSFNNLWAGFLGKGLVSVDINSGELTPDMNDRLDPESLVNNDVWFIYEDELQNLWLGTAGGISWFDLKEKPIKTVGTFSLLPEFENTVVQGFDENQQGEILFSTEEKIGLITNNGQGEMALSELAEVPDIWSFLVTEKHLWVSSYGSGLFKYVQNKTGYHLDERYMSVEGTSLKNSTFLFEDKEGIVWLGTYGYGLARHNPVTGDFRMYDLLDSGATDPPPVLNISEGDTNNLWIGTYAGGLLKFNKRSGQVEKYAMKPDGLNSISHNTVLSVFQDEDGVIWAGTDGGGLNRLDPISGQFSIKTTRDGLSSNVILGIMSDARNNLWLSTNAGITRYSKTNDTFVNYDMSHGLVAQGFNVDASFTDSNGTFYLGSGNGFNIFHPDSLRPSSIIPPVFFSDLKVLNESVALSDGLLSKHVNFEESVTFSHEQNFFSFNFVALDYHSPSKISYAYKLEGLNHDWIYTDASNRQATYTNLDHGDYVLQVKASNKDGVWGADTASMNIRILPPPWKTWWAYTIYMVLLLGMLGVMIRAFIVRERLKANLLIEQLERKKIEELDQIKSRFFAGISHEFRTPLTLISTPVDKLLEKYKNDRETGWSLQLVKRNAGRLLRLINQLLDLSKLESGKLKLMVGRSDVISWVRIVAASFESLSESRQIRFHIHLPDDPVEMFYDKEKLEQILTNLLSNAFKFSQSEVVLSVTTKGDRLIAEVANDGEEIPQEDREKVFNRFYQTAENKAAVEGTGIGLALVKEFVELHHGVVELTSVSEKTTFSISLPISDAVYENDDRVSLEETKVFEAVRQQDVLDEFQSEFENTEDRPGVLVVEDNNDLRSYMALQLTSEYNVLEARDGREALDLACSEIPDLIISDIMMPEIDGIELLKSVRNDHKTNHIPVIMLTAKAEKETRLEGIEKGADHYLNKPFDMEELMVRVKSLLNQRKRIRNHYFSEFLISPRTEDIPSMDDQFLKRAVEIIEEQLDNHEFSVDLFAKELAVSRVQLHRKMKAIIGCSASEFMRHYRLKKAYQYLKKKKNSVSQIAYSVGFNNLSYFTKAFREVYNLNPSELLK